jgi:hypothetical protein
MANRIAADRRDRYRLFRHSIELLPLLLVLFLGALAPVMYSVAVFL